MWLVTVNQTIFNKISPNLHGANDTMYLLQCLYQLKFSNWRGHLKVMEMESAEMHLNC